MNKKIQITKYKLSIFKMNLSSIFFIAILWIYIDNNLVALANTNYYQTILLNKNVHVIKIDDPNKIKVVAKRPGSTVLQYVKNNKAWGGINGGFFNHSDGYPVSKIYINNVLVENPENNKALVNNKNLKPILAKIFNRSELRVLKINDKRVLDIVPNNYKLKNNEVNLFSIQAGPQLLPKVRLEEEGFIIKDNKGKITRDGISSSTRAFRSALGIKNNVLYLVTTDPVNINELSQIMNLIGCDKAMALDGGSSTTLIWTKDGKYNYHSALGKNMAYINSAIIIEK